MGHADVPLLEQDARHLVDVAAGDVPRDRSDHLRERHRCGEVEGNGVVELTGIDALGDLVADDGEQVGVGDMGIERGASADEL